MKKIDKIFDLKKLAKRLTEIREDETAPPWILLAPILSSPLTLEKIENLIKEWQISEKELPPKLDPATRWQLFTKFANDLVEEIRATLNRILEKKGQDPFGGQLEFRMVLDGSFGLYCNTNTEAMENHTPHAGDVIVERLPDGSYLIGEHDGEALGMAEDWTSCVEFVADHFDGAGYWDPEYEYQINVFQRDDGKLHLVNFEQFMTEEDQTEEDQKDEDDEEDVSKS